MRKYFKLLDGLQTIPKNLASLPPFIDFVEKMKMSSSSPPSSSQSFSSVYVCLRWSVTPSHSHTLQSHRCLPTRPISLSLTQIEYLHCTFSLTPIFSLLFSLSLLLLLVFVCSKPRARLTHKNYDRLLTHTHARTQLEDGFFLFFVFLLLHPLTAAAAAAGHHPGSSSFASQPEHSDRGRPARIVHGQRSPGIFCSSLSLYSMEKQVVPLENSHATDPNLLFFLLSAVVVLVLLLRTHTHTQCVHTDRRGKKSVAHTHAHTHFFRPTLFRPRRKFHFFHTPRKIAIFRSPAEVHSVAVTLEIRPREYGR